VYPVASGDGVRPVPPSRLGAVVVVAERRLTAAVVEMDWVLTMWNLPSWNALLERFSVAVPGRFTFHCYRGGRRQVGYRNLRWQQRVFP